MAHESPFFHYNSSFDAQGTMNAHAVPDLKPNNLYLTNFLGVLIDPKFFPEILQGKAGQVEPIPIPANWHADIAEWAAALRAVDLAGKNFTVIELGCGWGCWLNNTGAAARRSGREARLIGIEGDPGHIEFAREACATNGFEQSQVSLYHGIASAKDGRALFPSQEIWERTGDLSRSLIPRSWTEPGRSCRVSLKSYLWFPSRGHHRGFRGLISYILTFKAARPT